MCVVFVVDVYYYICYYYFYFTSLTRLSLFCLFGVSYTVLSVAKAIFCAVAFFNVERSRKYEKRVYSVYRFAKVTKYDYFPYGFVYYLPPIEAVNVLNEFNTIINTTLAYTTLSKASKRKKIK